MKRACLVSLVGALAAFCATALARAQQIQINPDVYNEMKFRYIGPVGNRATAVVGIPGNPNVYYVGAASGGIFKSTDGGVHWDPIFDDLPVSYVGSLAVAASDSNIVWAGTGQSFSRSHISVGNGVYKSLDAGKTWKLMGLEKTGRIANVIIDPRNPDIVLACALGHAYGPQPERGVFRTTDGGKSWEKTLFVDENTGCSDLGMDPNNPRILFAGMWQLEIHTYGRKSGGPGSGLFKSTDEGATWKRLEGHGLPHPPVGRIAVRVAQKDSNRAYALIETGDGVPLDGKPTQSGQLWRSDDGGENWQLVNSYRQIRGRTWERTQLPIAQIYHVTLDDQIPYVVYGNRQAGPSFRGPSNSLQFGGFGGSQSSRSVWHPVAGSESGFATPDPVDNNIIWSSGTGAGSVSGAVTRFDERNHQAREVEVWPENVSG